MTDSYTETVEGLGAEAIHGLPEFTKNVRATLSQDGDRRVYFDAIVSYEAEEISIGMGVESRIPMLTAATRDVEDVMEGDAVVLDGEAYTVRDKRVGGGGLTEMELEEV